MANPNAQLIKNRFPTGPCLLRFTSRDRNGTERGVTHALVLTVHDGTSAALGSKPTGLIRAFYIDPTLGNEPRALVRNVGTEDGVDPNAYDATTFNVLKDAEILPLPHAGQIREQVEYVVNLVRDGLVDRTAEMTANVAALDARVSGALARIDGLPGSAEVNGLKLDLQAVRNLAEAAVRSTEALLVEERRLFLETKSALEERLAGVSLKLANMDRLYQEMRADIHTMLQADQDVRAIEAAKSEALSRAASAATLSLDDYAQHVANMNYAQLVKELRTQFNFVVPRDNPDGHTVATLKSKAQELYARQKLAQQGQQQAAPA